MLGRATLARDEHLERGQDGELLLSAAADLLRAEDGNVVDDQHRGGPLLRRQRQNLLDLSDALRGPGLPQDGREQLGPVSGQPPGVAPIALTGTGRVGLACHPGHQLG
jgi:hypothetical protein